MNQEQKSFLDRAAAAARAGGHIFPEMAACEAALESAYGTSKLAVEDSNLFGMKQHKHPEYGTHALPTREFINGAWIQTTANWVTYPGWNFCFFDRMVTLHKLSNNYPHYEAALVARDAETYVTEVSKTWSTDPHRAEHIIAIYHEYMSLPQGGGEPK
jgi:flagellum-specific peptidoglycan hydrolase FlgJ